MRKKYKITVDIWAILLFLAIMLPNFIWFVFPAPNDILRAESITPVLDEAASISQVLFVAMLVFVKVFLIQAKYCLLQQQQKK